MFTDKKKFLALLGITFITFTAFLDFTVTNIALPNIQKSLSIPIIRLQWIPNVYLMMMSISMIPLGKLGDLVGVKKVFFIAALVFAIASALCASAMSSTWLIGARILQGGSAAALFTIGTAFVSIIFPEEKSRNKAMSFYSMLNGLGIAFGPTLGGLILTFLSWRWIFLINIPIIAIGFLIAIPFTRGFVSQRQKAKLDWVGILLLAILISCLNLALIHGAQTDWKEPLSIIYFTLTIASFVMLLIVESKKSDPLLRLDYFLRPNFIASAMSCATLGFLISTTLFFDPLYLRVILNQPAYWAGIILFAIPIMTLILPPFLATLIEKTSKITMIIIAIACAAIGSLLHAYLPTQTNYYLIIIAFVFVGSAWAITNVLAPLIAYDAVPPEEYGLVTGSAFSFFNIASSIGLALCVSLFHVIEHNSLARRLSANAISLTPQETHSYHTLLLEPENVAKVMQHLPADIHQQLVLIFKQSFMTGFHSAMLLVFAVCISGLFIACWLRRKILRLQK